MAQDGHKIQKAKMVRKFGQKMAKFRQNKQKSGILENYLEKIYKLYNRVVEI